MRKFGEMILNLDRRVIYTLVLVFVMFPLIWPFGLPFEPTPEVRSAFNDIEQLEPGSAVLISCDYGPNSMPETHPMYLSLLHQCFRRELRPVIITLVPQGPGLASRGLRDVLESEDDGGNLRYPGLVEGEDYAFLGYRPGGTAVMLALGQSITTSYETSYAGEATADMPLFKEISALGDFKYIFDIASVGYPPLWVAYGSERERVPFSACVTAVSAAEYYPYYTAGQFRGLVGGMKGTAEYEKLVGMEEILGRIPDATRGMDAQSAVHIFIVLAIILANIFYFLQKRWETEDRRAQ